MGRDDLRTRLDEQRIRIMELDRAVDTMHHRAEKAEAEAKQWEQSSAESVHKLAKAQAEVAELRVAIETEIGKEQLVQSPRKYLNNLLACIKDREDQLSQLQQDVRPLLQKYTTADPEKLWHELIETFLAKHPELKP